MTHKDISLLAVKRFKTLDIETDIEFKELIQMASDICDTPVALLTLLDEDIQWFKVKKGTDLTSMPREFSFCTHTVESDEVMVVPDATADARFINNPIVTGDTHVRFYAGAPLITKEGHRIGSICVVDVEPRELNKNQIMMLKMLGKQAIHVMEYRISLELLATHQAEVERQKEIIEKAEITLRSFFESSANFHVLLGKNGEVLDYNKVAYNFIKKIHKIKLKRGEMFIAFLAPDFVSKYIEGFKLALTGEKVFEEGFTDYGEHGIIWWEAAFTAARDVNNEVIGISYIIRDVTDRKLHEHRVIDQNKSLLKIAHLQAHEFRAPLTTILGMMNLIKSENYQPPMEYFELLEIAVDNLDKKIHEIVSNVDNMELFKYKVVPKVEKVQIMPN